MTSSIGTVTSSHHSSVCTSWMSAIWSCTIGMAAFSSSSPAILLNLIAQPGEAGLVLQEAELKVQREQVEPLGLLVLRVQL